MHHILCSRTDFATKSAPSRAVVVHSRASTSIAIRIVFPFSSDFPLDIRPRRYSQLSPFSLVWKHVLPRGT